MKGHSGGVSSAVEVHPAIPENLTKSGGPAAVDVRSRADNAERAPRLTATSLKRRADACRRRRSRGRLRAWRPVSRCCRPAGLYLGDHVKLWICSLPFFVFGAVVAHLYVGTRERTASRGVGQHRQGGRRPRRRLGVDRVLPPLPGSLALLGHRVGRRDHRRTRRRARSRATRLHSTPQAGQAASPDRHRRHRRPCGAPAAHVPAPSRPRLRGPRLRRPRGHRRARRRQECSARSTRSSASLHEHGANGVVVSPSLPDQRHQRARTKAHRSRLPRRALVEPCATST